MSLLDTLASEGNPSEAWIDAAVKVGRVQIGSLPKQYRDPVGEVIEILESNKPVLSAMSGQAFAAIVSNMSLHRDDKAMFIYLETTATFDERMAALDAVSDDVRKSKEIRDANWIVVKDIGNKIIKILKGIAVPFLLSIIGA